MAVGQCADPHIGIGRRDRQRADPGQGGGIADRRAIGVTVGKALAGLAAGNARQFIADIAQAGLAGGGDFGGGGAARAHAGGVYQGNAVSPVPVRHRVNNATQTPHTALGDILQRLLARSLEY
ncbi:hypothetical protein D3C71_1502590 [compost metagenome]